MSRKELSEEVEDKWAGSRTLRSRTRKLLLEQLGTYESIPCEYRFSEEGLRLGRSGTEVKFLWNAA